MVQVRHRRTRAVILVLDAPSLAGRDLRSVDLRQADLRHADLRGTQLDRACLAGANLCGARLRGASLQEADLREATLNTADLVCADLSHALVAGAHFLDARLSGACLDLEVTADVDWRAARYDEATRWPDGFDPEAAGARRALPPAPRSWQPRPMRPQSRRHVG